MSKVYFTATKSHDFQEHSQIARHLLEKLISEENITLQGNVPVKVHFGEKGNITFVPAIAYDGIVDYLTEHHIESSFIETNVLYGGERMRRDSHISLAKEHGFTRLPIIIADGDIGENYYDVQINQRFFERCKIGTEFQKYQQMIVCSHFKGHVLAGFGGAIKQLAMGCASRGGKLDQHSKLCPTVTASQCDACGKCKNMCSANAITIDKVAYIDKNICIGCAGCIAICPPRAVKHDWGADHFLEKLAEYALAASIGKSHIYINYISNITQDCDCMGHKMQCIAENVGIMASSDPVALDTASLDILQKSTGSRLFDMGRVTLAYCEKMGIGEMKYQLI
jgi:hypothetical protein